MRQQGLFPDCFTQIENSRPSCRDHHHDWFIFCHIPCDGCAEHLFIGSANDLSLGRVIRHNKRQRCTDRRSAFALIVVCLLVLFLRTETGLAIRATGDNLAMSEANGINTDNMKIIGYMISNGCIALSGSCLRKTTALLI